MFDHCLAIKDLTVSYDRVPAVHHVSLEMHCGKCIALLGPNGAGKTSLLKAIVGLLPRESGTVVFHGHSVKPSNTDIAYLPQRSLQDSDFPITVRGVVELGRFMRLGWWQRFGARDREVVDEVLESLHLSGLSERQFSALSGGQQQRVFLGRALAQEAHVFLLDEPLGGLDSGARELMRETMRDIAGRGNLVIASHHDLATVSEMFDQVILLNGELIAFGDTADTFTKENVHRTYDTEVFSGEGHH